ncbi:GTP-binding protein Rhes-like [Lingula anatina]|uniref:GTP-binding protein Rhes-like n=1 Tax=Lingula anatina TaxID=7574 RepID=A0A1S3I7S0_LINAN|nr:GTP-binding protein Rhes-like [Lingula anatina]|eukprot:XP_013394243.1 GTP-binding protein Rhes-like [Lingula anatina]
MRELAIRLGQAFIIVYSIDNRESFLIAKELMDSVHEIKGGSIAPLIMLIGNKSDTASDGLRQVETEEAEKATLGKNNCCFMETSAKKGRDVDTMFTSLLSKVLGVENSTNNFSKKKSRFMKRKHHSVNDMQPSTRQHGSVNRSQSWRDGTVRNMSDIDSPKCTLL